MDLKEFTSPLPKPWLNIFANSVHTASGGGSGSCIYSQTELVEVVDTAARTSISSGATAIGSLAIAGLPPPGTVIRLKAIGTMECKTGGFNVYLTINGLSALMHNSSGFSAVGADSQAVFESYITVLAGGATAASLTTTIPGSGYAGVNGSPALLPEGTILDFEIQFGTAGLTQLLGCVTFIAEVLSAA